MNSVDNRENDEVSLLLGKELVVKVKNEESWCNIKTNSEKNQILVNICLFI
jgi:hypothetical protein